MPVYSLVVGKSVPKFKESTPGEPHPNGKRLPGNSGVMVPDEATQTVHLYETSMATLAPLLSDITGRPIQDKTGLTGKYDLVFQKPSEMSAASSPQSGPSAADPGPSIFSVLGDIGLKLEPAKGSVETLVIDHVERPSEN
jgi:bla regulator protein BlaR1